MSAHKEEIAQIRGLLHLLDRAPIERKSQKSHEILNRIKKLLASLEDHHQLRLRQVSQSLVVLLRLLSSGSVNVISVEDHEAFNWARRQLEKFLEDVESDL
jgi:hypothetical protein